MDQGIIGAGSGLDVHENDKPIFFHNNGRTEIEDNRFQKLRTHAHVLLSGHQVLLTNETLREIAPTTIKNLDAWEESGTSEMK